MLPIETVGWMGAKEIPVRGKHLDELSAVGDENNGMLQSLLVLLLLPMYLMNTSSWSVLLLGSMPHSTLAPFHAFVPIRSSIEPLLVSTSSPLHRSSTSCCNISTKIPTSYGYPSRTFGISYCHSPVCTSSTTFFTPSCIGSCT